MTLSPIDKAGMVATTRGRREGEECCFGVLFVVIDTIRIGNTLPMHELFRSSTTTTRRKPMGIRYAGRNNTFLSDGGNLDNTTTFILADITFLWVISWVAVNSVTRSLYRGTPRYREDVSSWSLSIFGSG